MLNSFYGINFQNTGPLGLLPLRAQNLPWSPCPLLGCGICLVAFEISALGYFQLQEQFSQIFQWNLAFSSYSTKSEQTPRFEKYSTRLWYSPLCEFWVIHNIVLTVIADSMSPGTVIYQFHNLNHNSYNVPQRSLSSVQHIHFPFILTAPPHLLFFLPISRRKTFL